MQITSGFVVQPRIEFNHLRDQLLYQYLVSEANYKQSGMIEIGQAIIVLSNIEKETGWTRRMLDTSLKRLKENNHIDYRSLTQKKGVLITILNYEDYQNLQNYTKKQQKNVQGNVHQNVQEDVQENVQGNDSENRCVTRGGDVSENENVQGNVQEDVQENVQGDVQLINITAFINSINNNNINNNKTLKEYIDESGVKNKNLTSTEDIKIFVEFAMRINALPTGISKKIVINYFDCIRLTRQTCNISAKLLVNLIEKVNKYSLNQIHYAMWKHCEQHEDKREQYTVGIMRNTSEHDARRGLIKLKNKGGLNDAGLQDSGGKYEFGF